MLLKLKLRKNPRLKKSQKKRLPSHLKNPNRFPGFSTNNAEIIHLAA